MSVHAKFRTTSFVAASAMALNAVSSADGSVGLLDKVASSVGSVLDGRGVTPDDPANTKTKAAEAAPETPVRVVDAGAGCIVMHTKGRAVISSAAGTLVKAPNCDVRASSVQV